MKAKYKVQLEVDVEFRNTNKFIEICMSAEELFPKDEQERLEAALAQFLSERIALGQDPYFGKDDEYFLSRVSVEIPHTPSIQKYAKHKGIKVGEGSD